MIDSVNRSLVPDLNTPQATPAAVPGNAFKGTLWEAFAGHAGPVGSVTCAAPAPAPLPETAPLPPPLASDKKTATATNLPPSPPPSLTRPSPAVTAPPKPRNDAGPSNDPVKAVSDAMTRVGLDPAKYNLRTGSLPITIPNGTSYEYPVLFADVGDETLGFWLPSALSSPGMIAANIGNMIGNPIYEIV